MNLIKAIDEKNICWLENYLKEIRELCGPLGYYFLKDLISKSAKGTMTRKQTFKMSNLVTSGKRGRKILTDEPVEVRDGLFGVRQ